MPKYDLTDHRHYMSLPVCGYCTNAWDIIYRRVRHGISPEQWLNFCPVGGCDPDVWDYLDDHGWPKGYKLRPNGRPDWAAVRKLPMPKQDNRVFHRRINDDSKAPWRTYGPRLLKAWGERKANGKKPPTDEELVFDDEPVEDEEIEWADDDDLEW